MEDPYQNEQYLRHIQGTGACRAIGVHKQWCVGGRNHQGPHWSYTQKPDGELGQMTWTVEYKHLTVNLAPKPDDRPDHGPGASTTEDPYEDKTYKTRVLRGHCPGIRPGTHQWCWLSHNHTASLMRPNNEHMTREGERWVNNAARHIEPSHRSKEVRAKARGRTTPR